MKTGETIIIGGIGQQEMQISNPTVNPHHARLTKIADDRYVIEDMDSTTGVFVFGLRVKRKTVKADTPIVLGSFKTNVRQLMDNSVTDLGAMWNNYDKEKQKWDRYGQLVNMIRILPTAIIIPALAMFTDIKNSPVMPMVIIAAVLVISFVISDKVSKNKSDRMAELNAQMQRDYVCPHCHQFLGFTPYKTLKSHIYCPHANCGVKLP